MKWSGDRERLIYLIYNIALAGFFILVGPYLFAKIISGKYRAGLKERLGFLPENFLNKRAKRIWIHAVSVGEVGAAAPIAREIKKIAPSIELFISTTTATGREVAKKRLGKNIFYYPLDFPRTVMRTLSYVMPDIFVAVETEIWPNLFRELHRSNVPIFLLNARVSNRSFQGYRKIGFLLKTVLAKVSFFGAQSEEDADRFKKLGVSGEKILVSGNSKFDSAGIDTSPGRLGYFESLFGVSGRDTIVFGSTHPGEEEIIIEVCRDISKSFSSLRFILCPRHPERAGRVEELVMSYFKVIRRSELKGDREIKDEDFIILDTVGELAVIYGLASIVFVGGSLIPKGGQNIIEPAFWGKPIIFGPYVHNFREIVRIFLEKGAASQVRDKKELKEKLVFFLGHRDKANEMGRRAKAIVSAHQGASQKNAELVWKHLCL